MTTEQGAEDINLGNMEHRVCPKIMVFYTVGIFRFACHFNTEIHQLYTLRLILIQGAKSQMSGEQGDTKIDLRSTKNYFGEHQENNSGSREKRVKFQREPGAGGPPRPKLFQMTIYLSKMAGMVVRVSR